MKQKLYLHIGLHKTGTTSIQDFLELNEDALKRRGLVRVPHWVYVTKTRYTPEQKALDFIDAHLGCGSDLVLSNEEISVVLGTLPGQCFLRERFPDLDLHLVVYLRRQDLHMESMVFHRIAGGLNVDVTNMDAILNGELIGNMPTLGNGYYDYASWLEPLADLLGPDNIHVRVFEPRRFKNGSLTDDFLDALGLETGDDLAPLPGRSNESLDARFALLLNRQYEIYPELPSVEKSLSKRGLLALNKVMGGGGKILFSPEERREILARFEASNSRVAKRFLNEDGPLFDQTVKDGQRSAFSREELETMPLLLNRLWYNAVADMDFGTYNTIKMRAAQARHHAGDPAARKEYRWRKLLNSLGKLFNRNFYSTFQDFFPGADKLTAPKQDSGKD